MPRFEVLDIPGDVGIRAFGRTLAELFENAAAGMSSLITDSNALRVTHEEDLSVTAVSLEGLLVAWLNELVFLFDARNFIGRTFRVSELKNAEDVAGAPCDCSLRATVSGTHFDPAGHEQRLLIKAATYHDIEISQTDGRWEARVVFDI